MSFSLPTICQIWRRGEDERQRFVTTLRNSLVMVRKEEEEDVEEDDVRIFVSFK